jgi:hypothetical protein
MFQLDSFKPVKSAITSNENLPFVKKLSTTEAPQNFDEK